MKKLFIASTTMMTRSAIIIIFVMRSRPLCRPLMHTKIPMHTTITMQSVMTPGFPSMPVKVPETVSTSAPSNFPAAVR